ncbi:methyltransferase family protein [Pseudanabaena sp. ABRG5-3]|uniref:methyltransferase family protein n=1 Tax=Pseudanabaena sp. ABRG5-3 TaxID=685565 RepID=UPI000DC72A6E|nr:isoprenylcysteine carboxylmethyltransferase family protein [Pseudanabaena sp. ABRG5-3]BBC26869.1 isoprenylcysteine carboxyl methyltransferase [Pseudanabaena sp. ABRG5-3]
MKLLSDWGITSEWWRGRRGEYWVIAQGILLLGFPILPTTRPSLIDLSVSSWQAISVSATAILGIWAVVLLGRSLFDLGQNLTPLPHPKDDGQLVQTGIYSLVRHPIYSGVVALALSYACWHMSWLHLLGAIALFIFFDAKARQEEFWLTEKFPDYVNYRHTVKKLIPWIY